MLSLILLDINTANAMIAARQENVAQMLQASRQRSKVWPMIGSMLIRAGERLRNDVDRIPERTSASCPTPLRPELPELQKAA